jgi:hypothetical protein
VFHEGGQRHVEWLCQLADAGWPFAQAPEHRSARGVGEGLEEDVQLLGMLFHAAK